MSWVPPTVVPGPIGPRKRPSARPVPYTPPAPVAKPKGPKGKEPAKKKKTPAKAKKAAAAPGPKKPRSPAQQAATQRMLAANAASRAGVAPKALNFSAPIAAKAPRAGGLAGLARYKLPKKNVARKPNQLAWTNAIRAHGSAVKASQALGRKTMPGKEHNAAKKAAEARYGIKITKEGWGIMKARAKAPKKEHVDRMIKEFTVFCQWAKPRGGGKPPIKTLDSAWALRVSGKIYKTGMSRVASARSHYAQGIAL